MATFCFVLWDGGGNVTASVPIARRLVERGHTVDVLGDASLERVATTIPARFHPFTRVPPSDVGAGASGMPSGSGRTALGELAWSRRWLFGAALDAGADLVDHLDRHGADVVAIDVMLFGAAAGALAGGVPSAALVHSVWPFPVRGAMPPGLGFRPPTSSLGRAGQRIALAAARTAFGAVGAKVNRRARGLGVPRAPAPLGPFLRYDSMLVLTSPAFDFVPIGLPPHVSYVGPPLQSAAQRPLRSESGPPVVLVSLSTTPQRQGHLLQRLATALGRLPVRGLLTTGPVDPTTVDAPPNVRVERHLPHGELLPDVAAAVTHGGHGTTIAALAHGVPVLCIPHGRDQPDVAARVTHAGAGMRVGRRASVDRLAAGIRELLEDPRYQRGAARLAASMRAEGDGATRAADALEALCSYRGT